MKIVLVYPDYMKGARGKYYEGIASLTAVLKQDGHRVEMIHLIDRRDPGQVADAICRDHGDAGLVAFSATTNAFPYVRTLAKNLRRQRMFVTACGGVHATLCPEDAIEAEGIDIVCVGEGEWPMRELCRRLDRGEDTGTVQSLWLKRGDGVVRNELWPLEIDLDRFPLPDRSLFAAAHLPDNREKRLVVMASRGCPFICAHCCNDRIRSVYPDGSRYVRFKSVGRVIEEIRAGLALLPRTEHIAFHDDILPLRKEWFREFARRYKEEIGKPYICNGRFELLDEEAVGLLKDSGCVGVKIGLESGNDHIRKEVLCRRQERELMLKVGRSFHAAGLRMFTFNMVGLPQETLSTALDTVKLNARLRPYDRQVTIFYPYPKTALLDVCVAQGIIGDNSLDGYGEGDTILRMNDFSPEQIRFAFTGFSRYVAAYECAYMLPGVLARRVERWLDRRWAAMLPPVLGRAAVFVQRVIKKIAVPGYKNKERL